MSWWLRALPALPESQAPTLIPGTVELWSERHSKTLGRLSQIPFGGQLGSLFPDRPPHSFVSSFPIPTLVVVELIVRPAGLCVKLPVQSLLSREAGDVVIVLAGVPGLRSSGVEQSLSVSLTSPSFQIAFCVQGHQVYFLWENNEVMKR